MNTIQILLSLLVLGGPVDAVYKRWIPNTNFENASNWAEQRLPCPQDEAVFASNKEVSVLVRSAHSLKSLYIPLDGEFILSPGAGFMAASADDPTCGEGSLVNFGDADHYQWFDPTLWQSAASIDDLENGRFLFSLDTEGVPCQNDDVIFSSETSFRVQIQIQEPASEIQLKSISVLGRKFISGAEFGEYLASRTGRLQFPDPAQPQVTNMKCQDKSGCLCGNERMQQEICSALLQRSGNKCPELSCANPLKPIGHCCGICGAIISLEYTSEFDLEAYRSRLIHTFLSLDKYSEVKVAVSKVQPLASAIGGKSLSSEPKIQVVCIDEKTGSNAGTSALLLGRDIMEDIESHGQSFGIVKAELDFSTGASTSTQKGSLSAAGITGIVLAIVILVSLLGLGYFLCRMDVFRLPSSRFFWSLRNASRLEEPVDNMGFSNPIFEPTVENEEARPGFQAEFKGDSSPRAIQFSNPIFDGNLDV